MAVATRGRYAGLLIWAAYFVIPTDAGGLIHGVPLSPLDAIGLLMIAWLAAYGGRLHPSAAAAPGLPGAPIVAAILAVSFASAALVPGTGGFRARYFSNVTASGAHERSTEYPGSAFTRVDDRLDFTPGGAEFPLAFFNDSTRFNFYRAGEPNRRQLEFAVRWSGLWWVDAGAHHLYVESPHATAELFIDGVSAMLVPAEIGSGTAGITLAGGWHRLDVAFSSPFAAPRRFSAGVLQGARREPFDSTSVVTQQIRGWQMTAQRALRVVKAGVDSLVLLWLAWFFAISVRDRAMLMRQAAPAPARRAQALSVLALAGVAEALVFAWPWSRRVMLLNGGDDPMTYEGYARDILLNGILMNGGQPAGQGDPFYYQALYPYFLAAVHALFGEGMFGVMLVQRLLVVFVIWMLVRIATDLGGDELWPAAIACATFFACWKFWPIAADLLNESLYIPLLVAWLAALIRTCRAPAVHRATAAGLLGGFTALARSTALLAWPLVFAACWVAWKFADKPSAFAPGASADKKGLSPPVRAASRGLLLGVLVLSSLGVFSLITVRNWIVAHQFSPTSTELGVTLLGGNEVPAGVTIDPTRRLALYQRLRLDGATVEVIEYAIAAPRSFFSQLGRKALFVLGIFEPYAPGWGYSPVYIAVWTTALAGITLALRAGHMPAVPLLLPVVVAVTQLIALAIVYPKGERLILPVHTLLVPYSAIAVYRFTRAMRQNSSYS